MNRQDPFGRVSAVVHPHRWQEPFLIELPVTIGIHRETVTDPADNGVKPHRVATEPSPENRPGNAVDR